MVPRKSSPQDKLAAVLGLAIAGFTIYGAMNLFSDSTPEPPAMPTAPPTVAPPVNHYLKAKDYYSAGAFQLAVNELALVAKSDTNYQNAQLLLKDSKARIAEVRKKQAAEDAREKPHEFLEVTKVNWRKGGFESVCIADLTIKNNSPIPIGDIAIQPVFMGESGSEVGNSPINRHVIAKVIQPGKSRKFSEINFGFISQEAASARFDIVGAAAF